jgi:hypothetical protein
MIRYYHELDYADNYDEEEEMTAEERDEAEADRYFARLDD